MMTGQRVAPLRLSAFGDEIGHSVDEQLAGLRAAGLQAIEVRTFDGVNVVDATPDDLGRLRSRLDDELVDVSAVASPVGKSELRDPADVELGRLRRALDAAAALHTRLVRVFSYFRTGDTTDADVAEVVRRLRRWADEAGDRGLLLVLENESYVHGDIPRRCAEIVDRVASPALRLAFDPANFVQVGVDPAREAWPLLRDKVVHVHIKDAVGVDRGDEEPYPCRIEDSRLMESVRPAGLGSAGLGVILADLVESGYDGFLTLEPHLDVYMPSATGAGRTRVAADALRALLA
jgi:sugar phosphate isomerase/epimerase